jgi:hypothetical protein
VDAARDIAVCVTHVTGKRAPKNTPAINNADISGSSFLKLGERRLDGTAAAA